MIGRSQDRLHLLSAQEAEEWPVEPFHRYRQCLLNDAKHRKVVVRRVLKERTQCRKSRVATTGAIVAIALEVIQEIVETLSR